MKALLLQNSRHLYRLMLLSFALVLLASCESKKIIVNGLDEKEANEIVVFLSNKGIDTLKVPSKADTGGGGSKVQLWDISVDPNKAIEAMSFLNMQGLPRRRGTNLLGIFTKSGLVPSEMEEKIRYQAGLAEQIASTIRKIDGVLDADVQLSFPEEDPLNPNAPKGKVTASVYVKHSGVLDDPNSHLVTKIKRLVASSIPGLDYDNVTVIGDRVRFYDVSFGSSEGGTTEEQKQYVRVWTVIVAKESVSRFQILFFSFCLIILLLILAIIWLIWKFFPVLKKTRGWKELFFPSPIKLDHDHALEEKAMETAEKKKGKEGEQPPQDKESEDVT